MLIKIRPGWEIPERLATPEALVDDAVERGARVLVSETAIHRLRAPLFIVCLLIRPWPASPG